VLTWLSPGLVGWASEHVPGAGVVRDGARALVLCAPLLVVLVAEGAGALVRAPRESVARAALGLGAVLLPIALLPDLALGVGHRIEPADYPAAFDEARELLTGHEGDVLVLPLSSYRAPAWNHRDLVLDPVSRYLTNDAVVSDVLVIDGRRLSGEDPRVSDAARALAEPTPAERAAALAGLGIGAVVVDPTAPGPAPPEIAGDLVLDEPDLRVVTLDHVTVHDVQTSWEVAMTAAWLAFVLPFALAFGLALAGVAGRLRHRRSPGPRERRHAE
jgi:hypothetical protein